MSYIFHLYLMNSFLSLSVSCSAGTEQRAQGADPEAGVWLVGRGSGLQHAAGGSVTCGSRGATGVSAGGEGSL